MAYSGRLAIIAGGIGGLGTSTAKLLRANGARLALLYAPFEASRRDEAISQAYQSTNPEDITTHECDISSEPSVVSTFTTIKQIAKETSTFPSILVNAAGYVTVTPLAETSVEEATKNILPNLIGPFLTSKAFYNLYTTFQSSTFTPSSPSTATPESTSSKPPGRIVSISSQAAHIALDGHGPYCASKAGLNALTRCMANEWGPAGITSNTVSPTVVMTTLGKKAWADEKKRAGMLAQIPTGRFAEPEEVASAIEYLCRDEAGMINGADIRIDGGFSIR